MSGSRVRDIVILVADLSGYTALTEAHGNASAAKIINRYSDIARKSLHADTRVLERVGDEILFASTDATSIVRTAIRLVNEIEAEPFFPTVHAGIHAGKVFEQEGRCFGSALNIASRVASHARGCQILCTKVAVEMAEEIDDIKYRAIGEVNFKNIFEPIALFEIITDSRKLEVNIEDPVCRMLVNPNSAAAQLAFKGKQYYFCSFECAQKFATRPDRFAIN